MTHSLGGAQPLDGLLQRTAVDDSRWAQVPKADGTGITGEGVVDLDDSRWAQVPKLNGTEITRQGIVDLDTSRCAGQVGRK